MQNRRFLATLSSTLQYYIESKTPSHGQKIHAHFLKTSFIPNANTSIKLLILHLLSDCLLYARRVFDQMPYRSPAAYKQMISGYVKADHVQESLAIFREMTYFNIIPDRHTFSMILNVNTTLVATRDQSGYLVKQIHAQILKSYVEFASVIRTKLVYSYVRNGLLSYAQRVFDVMLDINSEIYKVCATALITGYMNHGEFQNAEEIFNQPFEKDVVVFNAMIEGYSKSSHTHSCISMDLFIKMQRSDFRPTISSLLGVIKACSFLASFQTGQQVQAFAIKANFDCDSKIGNAVIAMYSKCGEIEEARRVFDRMVNKNVVSWSSMMGGYGKNGHPFKVIALFNEMREDAFLEPDDYSFLAVLSACGHAGLVDEGRQIFQSMKKPKKAHYNCMVDLLGRAGNLNEAWEFVMGMPEKPYSKIWMIFLGKCWVHGDVKMAQLVAAELSKCEGDDVGSWTGAYISLSNAFANAGNWENVSAVEMGPDSTLVSD